MILQKTAQRMRDIGPFEGPISLQGVPTRFKLEEFCR